MRSFQKKLNIFKLLSVFTFLILFSLPIRPAFPGNTLSVDSIQGPSFTLYYDLISGMGSNEIWFPATSNQSMNATISTNPFVIFGNLKGCEFDLEGNLIVLNSGGFSFDVFAISLSKSNITLRSTPPPSGSTFQLLREDLGNVAIGRFSWNNPPQDEINLVAFEASVGTAKIGKKNQRVLKIFGYSDYQAIFSSSQNRTKFTKSNVPKTNYSKGATAFTTSEEEEEISSVYYYDLSVNAYGGVYVLADLDYSYIPDDAHPIEVYFDGLSGGTQPNPPYNTLMVYKGNALAFNVNALNSGESTQVLTLKKFSIPDGAQFTNPPATKEGYASAQFQWPVGANVEDGVYTAIFGAYLTSGSNSLFPTLLVVNIKVQNEPPAIGSDPTSLSFNGAVGGQDPASQTLSVFNAGGGTLNWTASKTQSWLTLLPASGSSAGSANPNQITVSASISGLPAGTHTDTITISAEGASNTPLTIPVSLSITAPAIGLNTTETISFSGTFGGSNPDSQNRSVWNSGPAGTTLNWNASKTKSWLNLSPTSGSCGSEHQITASVEISGLSTGTHTDTITISDPNASNNSRTIPVNLTLTGPEIGLDKQNISFSGTVGTTNPASETLSVWNSGSGGTLNWTATKNQDWLTLSSASGSSTGSGNQNVMTVSVNITGLTAGTHNGTITITAPGASTRTVPVTLTLTAVTTPPPRIGMDPPDSISFANTQVGSTPAPKSLQISNQGGGTLNWSITSKPSWVNLSSSSGQLTMGKTSSISVSAASGLSAGTHTGGITVSAPGASNPSMTVPVTLTMTGVVTAPPRIGIDPSAIDFDNTPVGSTPAAKSLQISNQGGGTLNWSITSKPSWVNLSLSSGQLTMGRTNSIAVSANTTNLSAGTHTGGIAVSAPGASNPSMTVPVTLTLISSTPTIGVNPESLSFTYYTEGTPPSSKPLSVYNASGGTLRWTASENQPWLAISPTTGSSTGSSSPTTMTVSVNINDPSVAGAGSYSGTITISDNGSTNSEGATISAVNAPKTVIFTLNVIAGPPPASCDPSVPHITGTIPGGMWGATGTVVGQNEKSYCIVLPDGLPPVDNQTYYRPAVPPGTPYQITLLALDSAGEFSGSTFNLTLKKPNGEIIGEGDISGGVTMLALLMQPPGAYLVNLKIRQFAPGVSSAGFRLAFSTNPGLMPGELK